MNKVKNMKKTVSFLVLGLGVLLQSNSLLAFPGFLSRNGDSKLHKAVMTGDLQKVIDCYKKNPKLLDRGNKKDITPLRDAIQAGDDFIVSYLIKEAKANVNTVNYCGQSVLQHSISCEYVKGTAFLLEAGANIHSKDIDGLTALHRASVYYNSCSEDTIDIVTLLLAAGADTEVLDGANDKPDLDDYWKELMGENWKNIDSVYRDQFLGAAIITVINKYNLNATKILSEDWQGRLDMNLFEYK